MLNTVLIRKFPQATLFIPSSRVLVVATYFDVNEVRCHRHHLLEIETDDSF